VDLYRRQRKYAELCFHTFRFVWQLPPEWLIYYARVTMRQVYRLFMLSLGAISLILSFQTTAKPPERAALRYGLREAGRKRDSLCSGLMFVEPAALAVQPMRADLRRIGLEQSIHAEAFAGRTQHRG
jgi:hypothetical protein